MARHRESLHALRDDLVRGRITRRQLLVRAGALGISLPLLAAQLRHAAARQRDPVPPVAKAVPQTTEYGDIVYADPYAWLEDPTDPEVIAYLEAENAYTEAVLAPTESLRSALYEEMVGRIQRTDTQVPFRMGTYFYYTRTEEGRDYAILCRKPGTLDALEEILIDFNDLAGEYLEVGYYAPSYDHRYLAYGLNDTGGLEYTLFVKDLESGDVLPDQLPSDGWGFEWAGDNQTLFYTRMDDALRPFELYRHRLGTDPDSDPMLYREDDPIFSLGLVMSDSKEYVFLTSSSFDSSEVRYLRADQPTGTFSLFAPRRSGILYFLEQHEDDFLVLTNENAINFKLEAVPVADQTQTTRRELIPARDSALLQAVDVFTGHLLVYGRENGLSRLWTFNLATDEMRPLKFEEPVHTVWLGDNRESETTRAAFVYTSFVTPISFYEIDLATGERTLLKQEEVVGGHDPDVYVSERVFATAPDGTDIPISLVRRRDATGGPQSLLLDGYGAYGWSYDPFFASNELSLINRGVTYAIAHVRGGQELGRLWYEDGKLLNKKNTFSDFIACAEHLIAEGYTQPDRVVANGASAGGMLMGVSANERPDLFQTVVAQSPFVDVLRVMLDPSQPLTTSEFVEWGDPRDPAYYDYIRSYSPYDNVTRQEYPNLFLSAGLEDDRVPYWQPAKLTAKLRAMKTDDKLLLLRTNMGAGHWGESGFYGYQEEMAFLYAFVLSTLNMTAVDPAAALTLTPPQATARLTTL